jgi:hypothetical protein
MSPKLSDFVRRVLPGLVHPAGAAVLVFGLAGPSVVRLHAVEAGPEPVNAAAAPNIVPQPLPPASNDTPDDQPTPAHVWISGHWHWSQGAYAWVSGHWEIPPVPNATWVPPQWEQQGSGYALREGVWQQNAPTAAAAPAEIASTQPPPPPRPETIPERPSGAYVWIPGYWDYRDNQFRWVDGRWDLPPKPDLTWVPTHWESRDNRYVLVAGFWRENAPVPPPAPAPVVMAPAAPPPQVVVMPAPPPVRPEVVYSRPSPFHVWVPGYWRWYGGRYVWVAGHWERPPHGHGRWEEPRWERRGGSYVFIEGHWR